MRAIIREAGSPIITPGVSSPTCHWTFDESNPYTSGNANAISVRITTLALCNGQIDSVDPPNLKFYLKGGEVIQCNANTEYYDINGTAARFSDLKISDYVWIEKPVTPSDNVIPSQGGPLYLTNTTFTKRSMNTPGGVRTSSIEFNTGYNNYLSSTDARYSVGSSDFSVAFWIYMYSGRNYHDVVCKGNNGYYSWRVWVYNMTKIQVQMVGGAFPGGHQETYDMNFNFSHETWYHVGVSIQRGVSSKLYINADLVASDNDAITVRNEASTQAFQVGYYGSTNLYMQGLLSDLWFVKRVLTRQEFLQIYKYLG